MWAMHLSSIGASEGGRQGLFTGRPFSDLPHGSSTWLSQMEGGVGSLLIKVPLRRWGPSSAVHGGDCTKVCVRQQSPCHPRRC